MHEFSAVECVRFGWQTFKKRVWFLVGVTALGMVLSWVIAAVSNVFGNYNLGGFLGAVINIGLSTLLFMGLTALMIHAHDSIESASVGELWHPKPFLKYLAAEILAGLIVLVGLILLIIPGIIAALLLVFIPYLVIDKDLGPIEAIQTSVRIARGSLLEILLLILLILVVNIFGALLLLVGLLVTIPVTTLALVHAYRTLELKAKQAPAP